MIDSERTDVKTQSMPWRYSLSKSWQTSKCGRVRQCDEGLDKAEPQEPRVSNRSPRDSAGNAVSKEGQDSRSLSRFPLL